MRAVGGVIAGVIVSFILALAATLMGIAAHPLPKGFNPKSAADLGGYYMSAPFSALVIIVVGLFLGGFAGGAAANGIAARRWPAWIVGVLLALYTLSEMLIVAHPMWMQIAAVLAPLAGAAVAHHFIGHGHAEDLDEEEGTPDEAVSHL